MKVNKQKTIDKKKDKYFIYTGNAYPHKNIPRLIEAIVLLNKSHKVSLYISSSRSVFTQRLEKLIKEKGASNSVKLLGYASDQELEKLYKNSVAFVFPTLMEGFGLPPLEAIRAGAFAVVSDIAVLKEVYQDSVLYFDPYNVESITNSLEKVLSLEENEKIKLIKHAQEYIKKYNWEKTAKETIAIYESVI